MNLRSRRLIQLHTSFPQHSFNQIISILISSKMRRNTKISLILSLWGCLFLGTTIEGRSHSVFEHGNRAEVDYSFNETAPIYGLGLHSVVGCPKSIDGYPWVQFSHPASTQLVNYDMTVTSSPPPTPWKDENQRTMDKKNNTIKPSSQPQFLCHLAGFQGPCPEHMILFYKVDSLVGQCTCDCTNYTLFQKNGFCLNPRTGRNIVYIRNLNRCYAIFDQGPCRVGEWLILSPETYSPICERRRCSPTTSDGTVGFTFFNYHLRNCYQTDKVYLAGETPGVQAGIRFDTVDYDWIPKSTNTNNLLDDGTTGGRQANNGGGGQYVDSVWSLLEFPGYGETAHHTGKNKGCPQGTRYSSSLQLCLRPFSYFA